MLNIEIKDAKAWEKNGCLLDIIIADYKNTRFKSKN